MEADPSEQENRSHRDRIVRRLAFCGIPIWQSDQPQQALVDFVKENRSLLPQILTAILHSNDAILLKRYSPKSRDKKIFRECMMWLQWLMFEKEPHSFLNDLATEGNTQRGVCGALWGKDDLAYRCRTCEHDPTCAICVPCFQNGNHKGHDYSIIYTEGGCCDCGDETAWKPEGFCSKHKGAEQIKPLSEGVAKTMGPVLDALFRYWEDELLSLETMDHSEFLNDDTMNLTDCLTSSVTEMLLNFCANSEMLLSFISKKVIQSVGLLDVLVRAERFLHKSVVEKLHKLLLKLLGDPVFKYEFAKVFIPYYPTIIHEAVKNRGREEDILEKYPLISHFSVQIFTVPTLVPEFIKEGGLFNMILICLRDIFITCIEDDGQFSGAGIFSTLFRVVHDLRFIMSNVEVPKYVAIERPDLLRAWLELLTLLQGVDPLKRLTSHHVEEENQNLQQMIYLWHYIAEIHSLLIEGIFSTNETTKKEGATSSFFVNESSKSSLEGESSVTIDLSTPIFGSNIVDLTLFRVQLLISECLRAMDKCLEYGITSQRNVPSLIDTIYVSGKKSKLHLFPFLDNFHTQDFAISSTGNRNIHRSDSGGNVVPHFMKLETNTERMMKVDSYVDPEFKGLFCMKEWPEITYDVSSENVSFYIPLHRLLGLLLHNSLRRYDEFSTINTINNISNVLPSGYCHYFFSKLLEHCHPYGFSAFVMEHPLRLRVFCAQERAGMWRRNGRDASYASDYYRCITQCLFGIEIDLFLLQCCASLAPPDLFIERIVERFGLSNYCSLSATESNNEYEPMLMQEMLTLIIQIVIERRFSGFSPAESLRRELICRLSVGDYTRSQLLKNLPPDLSKSEHLQELLDSVALYSSPSRTKQGKYSLRKECWKELDLYHPRWNYSELQAAEDRYSQACKASAFPIQSPKWTKIYAPLAAISNVVTSKAVFCLIRAVFVNAILIEKSSISRAPEGVTLVALHLLSLALDICSKKKEDCVTTNDQFCMDESFPILVYVREEIIVNVEEETDIGRNQTTLSLLVHLLKKYKKESETSFAENGQFGISSLIENLLKKFSELSKDCMTELKKLVPHIVNPLSHFQCDINANSVEDRKAKARARQAAIMEKMRDAQSNFVKSIHTNSTMSLYLQEPLEKTPKPDDVVKPSEESQTLVCSLCRDPKPRDLSYLVLLQKSRVTSFVERAPRSWDDIFQHEKEFSLPHSSGEMIEPSVNDVPEFEVLSPTHLRQLVQNAVNEFAIHRQSEAIHVFLDYIKTHLPEVKNIHLPKPTPHHYESDIDFIEEVEIDMYHSIWYNIFQDKLQVNFEDGLDKDRNFEFSVLGNYISCLLSEISEQSFRSQNSPLYTLSTSASTFTSFDGLGPEDCDGVYVSSCGHAVHIRCHERYLSSLKQRYERSNFFEGGHIVDPNKGEFLCPVCRRLANSIFPAFPFDHIDAQRQILLRRIPTFEFSPIYDEIAQLSLGLYLIESASNIIGKTKFPEFKDWGDRSRLDLQPMSDTLCKLYFPGKYDYLPLSRRCYENLILWDTLRYSLISEEIAARNESFSILSGASRDDIQVLCNKVESSACVLPMLLQVSQIPVKQVHTQVLLRFRGLQLFSGSICSGKSLDNYSFISDSQSGNISRLLNIMDKGVRFHDIQFWKRASDPILFHDPFSSLMWVMFSLPRPFMASVNTFLALVHVFYVVCLTQAIITCRDKLTSEPIFAQILNEISKSIGKSEFTQSYFASDYINYSSHPKDIIRGFTIPYLRRCVLLWKTLKTCFSKVEWQLTNPYDGSYTGVEFKQRDNLELFFQISPLEVVLSDETVHNLVRKWVSHLCEEFKARKGGRLLYSTPAVPLRLMKLPHVYEDLLQRYPKKRCATCKSVHDAMCLICGKLCSGWNPSCRTNSCKSHAKKCGAGIGVFLLVKNTRVLLLRNARSSVWASPYLDAFGEEDIGVKRGRPLYLNEDRYTALSHMVASHGLDRNTLVLRSTTTFDPVPPA